MIIIHPHFSCGGENHDHDLDIHDDSANDFVHIFLKIPNHARIVPVCFHVPILIYFDDFCISCVYSLAGG